MRTAVAFFLLATVSLFATIPEAKLSLSLGHPQELTLPGNKKLKIDGDFVDGKYLLLGGAKADGKSPLGLSIPVEDMLQKQGTVLVKARFRALDGSNAGRYFLTLRAASRMTAGFVLWPEKQLLQFGFGNRAKQFHWRYAKKIETERDVWLGFSYDGTTVRIYVNGLMVAEKPQPLEPDAKIRFLHLGPYADGWARPPVGAKDQLFAEIRIWDAALTAAQVAELCGAKVPALNETHPMTLTVPAIRGAAPELNGELTDEAWNFAASMPRLIAGVTPVKTGKIPPHSFRLMHDARNLYLGFTTLFPPKASILAGHPRTPDKEPEVWGTESFEFYLDIDGRRYRFGGNVTGGSMEWLGRDSAWDGPWTYRTHISMNIDDSKLWTGEVAIPWSTLGLSGPPAKPIAFNFCRSWRITEFGQHSSLNFTGGGYGDNHIELRFASTAPVLQVLSQNDPSDGEYRQEIAVATPKGGNVRYTLEVARMDGAGAPMELFNRTFSLGAGERQVEKITVPISSPAYDALLYTLYDGPKVVMREFVPFQLSCEYFTLQKLFLRGELRLKLKDGMLKAKYGASFVPEARLTAPDGKVLCSQACPGISAILPFDKGNVPGMYTLSLLHPKTGEQIGKRDFNWPGIGSWATKQFDNRIIPPFLPLDTKAKGTVVETKLWNRAYRWNNTLFASSITSGGKEMLAVPVSLEANGEPLTFKANLKLEENAPHRVAFTAQALDARAEVTNHAWLEYDGVNWNRVTLQSKTFLKGLRLKIALPAAIAKYFSACTGTWASQINEKVHARTVPFYPVLWLGMEDKGLCFFVESRGTWKGKALNSYRIVPEGNQVTLVVELADALQANEIFSFEFGLLGTPVRPFPKNYPLNYFVASYTVPFNRPGRMQLNDAVFLNNASNIPGKTDLGNFFGDLGTSESRVTYRRNAADAELVNRYGGRAAPYTSSRYLSIKYPEMEAFKDEWEFIPEIALDYGNTGHLVYDCCPTTGASAFFVEHAIKGMLKGIPGVKGIYFDFAVSGPCSNELHGCKGGYPLLGLREFYRRITLAQLDCGITEPLIICHNTDNLMFPVLTFATHLLDGERVRQASSTLLHHRKDILDTYGIEIFATELSSLGCGITNSVYLPADPLMARYGGNEADAPYKFRQTKAVMAGTLIHNTIPACWRLHYGIFDKLGRAYEDFGVPASKFIGYWDKPASVEGAKGIYVSAYRHPQGKKALLVVSHVARAHDNQTFVIRPDLKALGLKRISKATDLMTAPDAEYQWLFDQREKCRIPPSRSPLELGDFGTKVVATTKDSVTLHLDYHCFSLLLLEE